MILPANAASLRVAEKAGLGEVGRTEHAGFDHVSSGSNRPASGERGPLVAMGQW